MGDYLVRVDLAGLLGPSAPLAVAVFLTTVGLVIARPRRLSEASAASLGALVMIGLGLVAPGTAVAEVAGQWNVLAFFLGLTGVAAVAERSGLIELLAWRTARASAGDPRRLLVAVVVVGALVSALFSNDAGALVLTPVIYVLVARVGLEPLPYVLACTFVADAASLALPISNPVNVIVSDGLGLSPISLIPVLLPMTLASVAALLGILAWQYLPRLPVRMPVPLSERMAPSPPTLAQRRTWAMLGLVGLAFGVGSFAGLPLGPLMMAGWLMLVAVERRGGRRGSPLEGIAWSLLVFVAAMTVVVAALSAAGVTAWLAELILGPVRDSPTGAFVVSAGIAAVGANLLNNLPAALVLVEAVRAMGMAPATLHAAALGTIAGADLGPNLTPVGSVATLLWLVLLRQRGFEVSSWSYIRIGLIVTPVTLAAALFTGLLVGAAR